MDFELTEEQRAFQELARNFAGDEMAPNAAAWDRDSVFPVAVLRKGAGLGFAGLYVRDADVAKQRPVAKATRISQRTTPGIGAAEPFRGLAAAWCLHWI